jgi:iron complex transport system permease protein
MPDRKIIGLIVAVLLACAVFLIWELHGRIWFILELRAVKLAGLCVVGAAIGISTVLFQTLSGNRILTPSIMGFDALFLLMQTTMVFTFGGLGYASLPGPFLFGVNATVMMIASVILFGALLKRSRNDIQLMILVGVVFGLLFRSLASFINRLIDPSEFAMIQGAMFAQFGGINRMELAVASVVLVTICLSLWRFLPILDVMALGRTPARHLGVDYDRIQFCILIAIAALVSISTALVGPITFLGLLVSALAHSLMKTHRHAALLPAAALTSMLILVFGQALFERILRLQSSLAVVIEFIGGLLFLILLAKGKIR